MWCCSPRTSRSPSPAAGPNGSCSDGSTRPWPRCCKPWNPSWGGLYTHVRDGYNIGKPPMDTRPATIGTRTRPRPPAGRPRCAPTRPPHRGHGDRDRGLALLRPARLRHHRRTAQRRPRPLPATRATRWGRPRPRRLGQDHRVRDPPQSQVHRLPGVQPARVPIRTRQGQRPRQVGVVTRTHPRTADREMDVRRTPPAPTPAAAPATAPPRTPAPKPAAPTYCAA
jgi:hypothetical protein